MREPFLHPCCEEGCAEEGSFGEGVRLLKGERGVWRCRKHEREHQARREKEAAEIFRAAEAPAERLL